MSRNTTSVRAADRVLEDVIREGVVDQALRSQRRRWLTGIALVVLAIAVAIILM